MKHSEKHHIIWSNECYVRGDQEELFNELKFEYPEATKYDLYDLMNDINNEYLYDERINLNIDLHDNIVVIADLGLWNGRHYGYKEIGNNIAECLYSDCDFVTWYVDRYNNLCCTEIHHDGTNFLTYRVWKEGLSDTQKENFLDKIYEGKATSRDITRYTKRLGDYINQVYGWK